MTSSPEVGKYHPPRALGPRHLARFARLLGPASPAFPPRALNFSPLPSEAASARLRGGSGGTRTQAGRQAQSAGKDCKSYFLFHFLSNGLELVLVAPGLVLWGAPGEPLLQPPPGGESPAALALLTAWRAATVRPGKSGERLQRQEVSRPGGQETSGRRVPERTFAKLSFAKEAAAEAVEKRRRRREEDVRSASLEPAVELGRARAAAAGRPLPLAAEEGTVFGVGAAETRRRPATAGSALPAAAGKRVRPRAPRNRWARESSGSDRDFSKPGGVRERTSKSAGGVLTLRSPGANR
eukprot:XP_023975720.2 uncharacterized protein LOC112063879 [Physeter catodon]